MIRFFFRTCKSSSRVASGLVIEMESHWAYDTNRKLTATIWMARALQKRPLLMSALNLSKTQTRPTERPTLALCPDDNHYNINKIYSRSSLVIWERERFPIFSDRFIFPFPASRRDVVGSQRRIEIKQNTATWFRLPGEQSGRLHHPPNIICYKSGVVN